jgi:predicted transcriptional regulator
LIAGVDFDEVWRSKDTGKLGLAKAYFAGIKELLKSKEASVKKRENKEKYYKDMHDIEALKRVMSLQNDASKEAIEYLISYFENNAQRKKLK